MREVSRKDRVISEEEAWDLLRRGEYGVLSTVFADGVPYGVPLNSRWLPTERSAETCEGSL